MLLLTNHATSPSYQRKDKYNKTIDSLMEDPEVLVGERQRMKHIRRSKKERLICELGLSSLV